MTDTSASVTLYFNPKCSKSRITKGLLDERSIDINEVRYLETPPDRDELIHILGLLDMKPRDLMRKGEAVYRELELDNAQLTDDDLVEAMISHPILIERPIVIADGKAVVARPPERVSEVIDLD